MAQARYKQVVDALAAQIRAGRLAPATRLPTHRQLAGMQGLALATASRVYAELEAMGLVVGETGRGTFVRDQSYLPSGRNAFSSPAEGTLDLSFSSPRVPGQADLLRDALRKLAASGDLDAVLHYLPHGGRAHERAIAAKHLASRGLELLGEQVLIVNGAQHGLAVTAMALLRPGDVVAVDALTYPGFKAVAAALKLELVPLPMGAHGTDLGALDRLCDTRPVRAVYCMPTLHNPLGHVMTLGWRHQLVSIARARDLTLIEDAAYAFLATEAPAPLATMAPERTVYISSLSKSVATGLRVGFVAADVALLAPIERAVHATAWNTAGVMTSLACGWMEDGTVARLENDKRRDALQRQRIADRELVGLRTVRHPNSYFAWVELGEDQRADRVMARLAQRGIAVSGAEAFATTIHVPQAIRVALGSVPSKRELRRALSVVREVVATDSS
jgi:DNA-binding transcriptional MocR family regulator